MKQNKSWWILLLLSLAVMLPFAAPYAKLDPDASRVALASGRWQYPILVAHIGFAMLAMLTGFAQFSERLRIRRPGLHRGLGRVYVICVAAGGALAIALVFYMDSFTKATAFLALSGVWLYATWRGYRTARARRFDEHRIWMIRSFGMTLVAVSGRIVVPVLLLAYAAQHGFKLPGGREGMVAAVLDVNIWAGLVLNLIAVEWIVLRPRRAGGRQAAGDAGTPSV
ncbi:DUF2306 domain-containing protein [Cohnella sp. 56]|uniref:DUF2306 domain-containing protein n=1 Tax=Cohnella sp. 56 TaxID=3113722 RepID=UPI0030EAF8F6